MGIPCPHLSHTHSGIEGRVFHVGTTVPVGHDNTCSTLVKPPVCGGGGGGEGGTNDIISLRYIYSVWIAAYVSDFDFCIFICIFILKD